MGRAVSPTTFFVLNLLAAGRRLDVNVMSTDVARSRSTISPDPTNGDWSVGVTRSDSLRLVRPHEQDGIEGLMPARMWGFKSPLAQPIRHVLSHTRLSRPADALLRRLSAVQGGR
jgi:hypothetical protein